MCRPTHQGSSGPLRQPRSTARSASGWRYHFRPRQKTSPRADRRYPPGAAESAAIDRRRGVIPEWGDASQNWRKLIGSHAPGHSPVLRVGSLRACGDSHDVAGAGDRSHDGQCTMRRLVDAQVLGEIHASRAGRFNIMARVIARKSDPISASEDRTRRSASSG